MKDQINTIREALKAAHDESLDGREFSCRQILTAQIDALTQLEAMAGEPVAWMYDWLPAGGPTSYDWISSSKAEVFAPENCYFNIRPLYTAAPVAQQYEAGDIASASAQGFRDGVASVAQPQARPDFTDEWTGYLKDGETPFERFLRERKDVQSALKLYQRALEENERLKAQQPQAETDDEILKERDDAEDFIDMLLDEVLGTDRPEWTSAYGRDDALRDVQERMTALHKPTVDKAWDRFEKAQQPQAEAVPTIYVSKGQLDNLKPDPEDTSGTYLPVRKSPKGKFTHPLFAAPKQAEPFSHATQLQIAYIKGLGDGAQQAQRPEFQDEWTGYLKDGETPFERFMRERRDLTSLTKLYQRVLEENEQLKAQQPQAEPFGYVSQHTNGTWEFSPTPAGVYPDTAKSITAVYAKQPQAEQRQSDIFCGVDFADGVLSVSVLRRRPDDVAELLHSEQIELPVSAAPQQSQADTPQATTIAEAARDVGKWLNERPNRPIDLRHVAMLVAHAMQPQAEAVPIVDRVYEAAKRLVDHADFQLGGVLSAKSKARDIPSNAASKVKARHLASLRDALAKTPQQAEAVPSDVVRDAAPIPDHELVTMYDERPTSDLEMIEFAREVERRHGIGVQPQHITDGSPCWCNPDVAYTDPETGASVILHRRPQ